MRFSGVSILEAPYNANEREILPGKEVSSVADDTSSITTDVSE